MLCLIVLASGSTLAATKTVQVKADPKAGGTLFASNCAGCHGAKAQGSVGPKLSGEVAGWSFSFFKRAVLTGVDNANVKLSPSMPRFGKVGFAGKKVSDAQLKNMQAFLKTLK